VVSPVPLTLRLRASQRLVSACGPLRRWFWIGRSCYANLPALLESCRAQLPGSALRPVKIPPPALPVRGQSPCVPADLYVAELPRGKVVGDAMLIANSEDDVAGDVQALHGVTDPASHWALRRLRYRRLVKMGGAAAVFAAAAGNNYFHWLFDSLPRLRLLELSEMDFAAVDYFLLNEWHQPSSNAHWSC
jgi:capsular polysaccharide biosynthesis protein